jgi:hypothetical protein
MSDILSKLSSGLHVKYPLFLPDFNLDVLNFLLKNIQISNLIKIRLVSVHLFHVERRTARPTDMLKVTVAVYNFLNVPKKEQKFHESNGQ